MPVVVGQCMGRAVMPVSGPCLVLRRTESLSLCVEKWVAVEMLAGGALGRSAMMSLNRLN